ncbi:MAG: hypothetical protein KME09_10580 [Pleurocapsa minor HA4230-MV1]|jgi:predicted PurR-regulated permease PerM|nr:hypothetical protein [Pleurocapsa minor HA4230-MV1]
MNDTSVEKFWHRISIRALIHFLLFLACGWAILPVLTYFETIITIFSLAAIIAFLLSYPVRWLNRFLPYGVAASLVFLLSWLEIDEIKAE